MTNDQDQPPETPPTLAPEIPDPEEMDPRMRAYLRNLPDPKDFKEPYYWPKIEDFYPSPPKPTAPLMRVPGLRWARPALFLFSLFFVASLRQWWWPASDGLAASGGAVFGRHEYWRLVTALFAHSGMDHLLANTPLFLVFGWFLRAFFGRLAFPGTAIVVGALSNLATIATYPADNQLLGASGMLYGMVALWLVFYVRYATNFAVPMRVFRAVGVSLLLLWPTTFEKNVSYMAHATGFLFGILIGLMVLPFIKVNSDVEDAPTDPGPRHTLTQPEPAAGGIAKPTADLHPPSRLRAPPGH